MFKRLSAAAMALLLLLLSACGAAAEDAGKSGGDTVAVTDDLGREVEVPARPQRVIPLTGSFADIWSLAGGVESIVAAPGDAWTNFDLGLPEDAADLGSVEDVELETLIAAEPDLILAASNMVNDTKFLDAFEDLGYAVLYFQADTFDEYLHMLDICTQLTGERGNYELYGASVQAQVDAALAMADGSNPSVLYIRASGSSCKARGSEGTVLGEMLAALDCRNIADNEANGLLDELSLEAIIAEDPDYIFVVYYGSRQADAQTLLEDTLLSNPAWAGLTAVREGRFYILDKSLYHLKPNAQWGTAYENLADILYGGASTAE